MSVIDNALQALLQMAHWEILWPNASPESSFAEQNISCGASVYDNLKCVCASPGGSYVEVALKDGQTSYAQVITNMSGSGNPLFRSRSIAVSGDVIEFGDSLWKQGTSSGTTNNTLIPLFVLGNKQK